MTRLSPVPVISALAAEIRRSFIEAREQAERAMIVVVTWTRKPCQHCGIIHPGIPRIRSRNSRIAYLPEVNCREADVCAVVSTSRWQRRAWQSLLSPFE